MERKKKVKFSSTVAVVVTTQRKWDAGYCLVFFSCHRRCCHHGTLLCFNSFYSCRGTRVVFPCAFTWDFISMKCRDMAELGQTPFPTVTNTNLQSLQYASPHTETTNTLKASGLMQQGLILGFWFHENVSKLVI